MEWASEGEHEEDEEQQPGPSTLARMLAEARQMARGMSVLKSVIENSKKGSKEVRVARAIASGFGDQVLKVAKITMAKDTLAKARKDKESLLEGKGIYKTIHSRARFDAAALKRAIAVVKSGKPALIDTVTQHR